MSQLIAMIMHADDWVNPEVMPEVWRQPMRAIQRDGLERSRYLDGLEATVIEVGWAAMRTLLVEQWRLMDQALARYRQEHPGVVRGEGHDDLKAVSRLGVISLPRQVCYQQEETAHHTLPGNTALPEHEGQVTTRGGQE
jgi:hypothetical protein